MNTRIFKLVLFYLFLLSYIIIFVALSLILASNILALTVTVISGILGFPILIAILALYVPILKASLANILALIDVGNKIKRIQIRWKVEGAINDYRERVDNEVRGLLPYPMRLNWVKSKEEVERYLDQRKFVVIVRMKPHNEEEWNLASATLEYVSVGLIHNARKHMNDSLNKAIDFSFTKKLLEDEGQIPARNYLVDQEINPVLKQNTELKSYYIKLLDISEELLTRVFLREVGNVAIKLDHLLPGTLSDDITSFLDWSWGLAKRDKSVPLLFNGKYLKVACILIAEVETITVGGYEPYIRRAEDHVTMGIDVIYLLARGQFIPFAKEIAKEIEKINLGLIKVEGSDKEYIVKIEGKNVKAIAILFRPVVRQQLVSC